VNRNVWKAAGITVLVLVLAGGAYMLAWLLSGGADGGARDSGPQVTLSLGDGRVVKAEWVWSDKVPGTEPDVVGAYVRRQDNSIYINETEGGFVLAKGDDDSFSVANVTGKIIEVVVSTETRVYVDGTYDDVDASLIDGKLYQQLKPGSAEEVGELSFVRAWGEMRGDRLISSVLVYNPPPVIRR